MKTVVLESADDLKALSRDGHFFHQWKKKIIPSRRKFKPFVPAAQGNAKMQIAATGDVRAADGVSVSKYRPLMD